jgi:hypothetical protein
MSLGRFGPDAILVQRDYRRRCRLVGAERISSGYCNHIRIVGGKGKFIRFISEVLAVEVVSADSVGDIKSDFGQSYVSPDAAPVRAHLGAKSPCRRTDSRGASQTLRPLDRIDSSPHDGDSYGRHDAHNEDDEHQLNKRKTFLLFDFYIPKPDFGITTPPADESTIRL